MAVNVARQDVAEINTLSANPDRFRRLHPFPEL